MAVSQEAKTAKVVRKPTAATKKPAQQTHNARRATSESTAARVTPMDDYEGVRQVLSRYCFALDSGQLEALSPLFHRDASFSVSFESGTTHPGPHILVGQPSRPGMRNSLPNSQTSFVLCGIKSMSPS